MHFVIPIEVDGEGFFFLMVFALVMVGPGQELGRAFRRVPDRLPAYTLEHPREPEQKDPAVCRLFMVRAVAALLVRPGRRDARVFPAPAREAPGDP